MARPYKCAVFDVDGTLLDASEGLMNSVRYTIRSAGLPDPGDAVLRTFVGPPVQDSFVRVYGCTKEEAQALANVFRERYKEYDLLLARPYEGIYHTFGVLRDNGIVTAIATYKREDYAVKLLNHFGFGEYTDIIHGADNENRLRKRDIIECCLREAGVTDPKEAVMVGDSDSDAVGAEALGMDFLAVTYGFGFQSEADCRKFPGIGSAAAAGEIAERILADPSVREF